jgi:hypothetical protein
MKVVILKSENGKITSETFVDDNIGNVVRSVASQALKEWNENTSDFVIMKDMQEVRIPMPLKEETYEKLKNLLVGREGSNAIAKIPIYIISFENEWSNDNFVDKKVYIVSYYINDDNKKELEEYAQDLTQQDGKRNEEANNEK